MLSESVPPHHLDMVAKHLVSIQLAKSETRVRPRNLHFTEAAERGIGIRRPCILQAHCLLQLQFLQGCDCEWL